MSRPGVPCLSCAHRNILTNLVLSVETRLGQACCKVHNYGVAEMYVETRISNEPGLLFLYIGQSHSLCPRSFLTQMDASLLITGHINGVCLVLANVYGPNWDNDVFFPRPYFLSLI